MNKRFFLIYIVILTFCALALANTCTDAVYKYFSATGYNPETDPHIEYSHSKDRIYDFSEKHIYSNKKIDVQEYIEKEDSVLSTYTFHYYDTDKSALSNTGHEILMTKCEAHDTLCIQAIAYNDGIYDVTEFIKETPNHTRHEFVSGKGENLQYYLYEYFLNKDTMTAVIKLSTDSTFTKGRTTRLSKFVADSLDEFKCHEYQRDSIASYVTYRATEKGFSLFFDNGNTTNEEFFVVPGQTSSIRKTVKPVKISPRASYFDLLGRYKFTK